MEKSKGLDKFEFFRIQPRRYSSNVIEGGYTVDDKLRWETIAAPLLPKKQGDEMCEWMFNILTG